MEKRANRTPVASVVGSCLLAFLEPWFQDSIGLAWYAVGLGVAVAIVSRGKLFALRSILKQEEDHSRGLLVYSDSPLWGNYIESRWLPAFGTQLVVWKLSSGRSWQTYIRRLFLSAYIPGSSERELPSVIICAKKKAPSVLHFHDAFLDLQFGDEEALRNKERRLAREIGSLLPQPGSVGASTLSG